MKLLKWLHKNLKNTQQQVYKEYILSINNVHMNIPYLAVHSCFNPVSYTHLYVKSKYLSYYFISYD